MSIEIMGQVWEHSKMEGAGLLTLLAIANYCNKEGFGWCSIAELSDRARVGRRQVIQLIKKAKRMGEIAVLHRAGTKGQLSNLYVVLLSCNRPQKKSRLQAALGTVQGLTNKPRQGVKPGSPGGVKPRTLGGEAQNTGGGESANAPDPSLIRPDPSITDFGAGAPQPPAEDEKPKRPLTDWQEKVRAMSEAIASVTGDDLNVEQTRKRVGQIAAQLLKAGYVPEDLPIFKQRWYAEDWRGKKGCAPTREQVLEELPRLLKRPDGNGHKPNPDQDAPVNPETAKYFERLKTQGTQEPEAEHAHH